MNLKYEKIFKSIAFHNIIAHPLMQVLNWLGKRDLANFVHDETLPENDNKDTEIANTENDIPEINRVKPK
jgi:hypothetical protein